MFTLWKYKDTECEIKVTLLKCTAVGYFVRCTGRYTGSKRQKCSKNNCSLGKKIKRGGRLHILLQAITRRWFCFVCIETVYPASCKY